MVIRRNVWVFLVVAGAGSPAVADDDPPVHPFLTDTLSVELGLFSPRKDVRLRVDGALGSFNASIDFEEEFGARATEDTLAAEILWRFGDAWSLRLQKFDGGNRQTAVLANDVEWEDWVIPAGSSVSVGSGLEMTRIFFGRSLDVAPRHDVGVGLGVHWLETKAFISAEVITTASSSSDVKADGPFPNIGAWYYYSPSEKWYVGARADYMSLSYDIYKGRVLNYAVGGAYQFGRNFGLGLKYQLFNIAADIDETNWHGRIDVQYQGPFFYVSANW
jgi:hypothetical protein